MISVAIATYNGEKYIEEQLVSILNQTKKVDEIIICDDCSNDKTVEVIKEIIGKNTYKENVILMVNEENLGYVSNFKKAIKNTKGKYIFLADQDDIWEENKVEKTIEFMKYNNFDATCSKFNLIDNKGNNIDGFSKYRVNSYLLKENKVKISLFKLAFGNISPGCTYCFKEKVKDTYLKVDNKDVIHDYQLMLVAATVGKVGLINEKLIKYRLHGNNSVGFSKKKRAISIKKCKIRKKPIMVEFFQKLNKVVKVPYYNVYITMYYLRIPYIKAKMKRLFLG